MTVGHIAPALLARAGWHELPWWLVALAVFVPDVQKYLLVLAGWEFGAADALTHAGVVVLLTAGVLVMVARWRGLGWTPSLVTGALVLSHAPLDWLTGFQKPVLLPGGPALGLELYHQWRLVWAMETVSMTAAMMWLDVREGAHQRRRRWGALALGIGVAGVLLRYVTGFVPA
jgi:hypothetical protein